MMIEARDFSHERFTASRIYLVCYQQAQHGWFANNVYNFVKFLTHNGTIQLDVNDEIVQNSLTTIDGKVVHSGAREAMGLA